jgi:hypothetical protein
MCNDVGAVPICWTTSSLDRSMSARPKKGYPAFDYWTPVSPDYRSDQNTPRISLPRSKALE